MKTKILAFGFLTLVLTGCTWVRDNPPTQKEMTCGELKRNLIFNTASAPNIGAANAIQRAEMERLYKKNTCQKLESKK